MSIGGASAHAMHPATRAATACGLVISELEPVEVLEETRKSAVYRVALGEGPLRTVVLKRCPTALPDTERFFYDRVLPQLSVPTLACLGSWETDGSTWIALEDAGDEVPTFNDPASRRRLTDWIVRLHLEGRSLDPGAGLPGRGPDHFATRLASAQHHLRERLQREDSVGDVRSVLERAHRTCELLTARWPDLIELCGRFPQTLVHGDLVEENLRVVRSRGDCTVIPLDWEKAGLGCPTIDLALADEAHYFGATRTWLRAGPKEYAELLAIGKIFRVLSHAWAEKPAEGVARYERRLSALMVGAGWSDAS